MSFLRGRQHWVTIGLVNDAQGQQDVLNILRGIRADFPIHLNLQSAPNCDRLKRAISRRIRNMPGNIPCLYREDALGALYELFALCRSDWSATGSARTEEVSGGSCEEGSDSESDSFFVGGGLGNYHGPFEEIIPEIGYTFTSDTVNLDAHATHPVEEYARQGDQPGWGHTNSDSSPQYDPMDVVTHEQTQTIAHNQVPPWQQRQEKYEWDWFNYQHTNVIFNAFVDITWARYPRCRETIRLSDLMGKTTNLSRTSLFPRARHQSRSPDGDWIRLDSVSLPKLRNQLQVIRSLDQAKDAIWWSPDPLDTTRLDSTESQARIDNQRDLTWAVYRSFDAPWQDWRGRRLAVMSPSQGKYPRFSIIIRDVEDLVDTAESMDVEFDSSSTTSSVCEMFEGLGGSGESICGDDLADSLSAIINEPLQPNGWVSGPL
ncbi:uncharacterized protein N7496_011118 [Penicillium cataractarum]|uniref:Uncharacterized protein n=1 Tax=Penicillium cataractarum TaxID=2100454 RepID=A0A9W9UXF5_9EURO|nr:uncharacterized protein N7496_011118 [Penicillium cataractarum]KAJ5358705.1 hypothetical protein N7496_011118 [Penicillium cataractarum]